MPKMHEEEFHIDQRLVQRLIAQQFPQWAMLELASVLSAGTDHALYRLGNEMVVRLPRISWAVENVEKEYLWLSKISSFLPISIPIPIAKGLPTEEYPYPWAIYSWLQGSNPIVGALQNPLALAHELASFIRALHTIDLPDGPFSSRSGTLLDRDSETRRALEKLEGMIDVPQVTQIWEKALKVPPWSKPSVWIHADLSPGNLLQINGHLSGVIDFGMLGMGDPACDLIVAWNLLPSYARAPFRAALQVDDATWERGKGWALSIALIQLPYYKDTNPALADNARHVISEVIEDAKRGGVLFYFSHAKPDQKDLIHQWLGQNYIREWIHGVGLQNTLNGLDDFFQGTGDTTYWIGYDYNIPFAFLITSPAEEEAITLDLFICDPHYLGKGLAVPMIRDFLLSQFPRIKRVLIDPETTNTRAVHVYKKVGFKIIGEFIASWHPVPHYQMALEMNDLLLPPKKIKKIVVTPYNPD
jgi:aminoglycoside phosphotransferase (APT) family kinase protein/RimJ/RimL family protein N-acetyltransferase